MDPRERAPGCADEQCGVFTAEDAVASGWSKRQVTRRLAAGRWRRVLGRGLVVHPALVGAGQLAWAATLTWPEAIVAGSTAAALHGFPVEITMPVEVHTTIRRRPIAGLTPHRRLTAMDEVEVVAGIPVTSVDRTIVDCLGLFGWGEALDLYAWLSSRELITHDRLLSLAHHRIGCHGSAQLSRLLTFTRDGAVSQAEDRFHGMLRSAGLTGWVAAATISDGDGIIGVVDVLFRGERVAIEIDGRRAHTDAESFRRDRRKQNRLVNAGYRVLRFTWWDLVERPAAVLREVLTALEAARLSA